MNKIQLKLKSLSEDGFADFTRKSIPTLPKEKFLGVRTPAVRKLAKELSGTQEAQFFLQELPHRYFEENQLHAFLISDIKNFDIAVSELEKFLPFIDNWATCDQTLPKSFKTHKKELLPFIKKWLKSEKVYTIRFAVGMLMRHFLDEEFSPEYLSMVVAVQNQDYYVKMEVAWYFAEALVKQWDKASEVIEQKLLEPWTHNKAIQKAKESFRISDEKKIYLMSLKNNKSFCRG